MLPLFSHSDVSPVLFTFCNIASKPAGRNNQIWLCNAQWLTELKRRRNYLILSYNSYSLYCKPQIRRSLCSLDPVSPILALDILSIAKYCESHHWSLSFGIWKTETSGNWHLLGELLHLRPTIDMKCQNIQVSLGNCILVLSLLVMPFRWRKLILSF